MTARPLPPDQADRHTATHVHDRCIAVEAGAGSGKTTLIVERVLAMAAAGVPLDRLALVTFTRAAAAELRQRLDARLDAVRREAEMAGDAATAARCEAAAAALDGAYVGTIHGFCARLLRERPVEAELDPAFREVEQVEFDAWLDAWLEQWLETRGAVGDADLQRLEVLGTERELLADAFRTLVGDPDVDFRAPVPPLPPRPTIEAAITAVRDGIAALWRLGPEAGRSVTDERARRLAAWRRADARRSAVADDEGIEGLRLLERLVAGTDPIDSWAHALGECKVTQWAGGRAKAAMAEAEAAHAALEAVVATQVVPLVAVLRAVRHAHAMQLLHEARAACAEARREAGLLGFGDLLVLAASLVRTRRTARRALAARFERIIVDEFQDTDPVQAELCFLLAAPDDPSDDWRTVMLAPGRLMVVGDPKQSIYRFRRADLAVYRLACERIAASGGLRLQLTANFRSAAEIADFANSYFAEAFGRDAAQAPFAPLQVRPDAPSGTVERHEVHVTGSAKGDVPAEAAHSAASLAARIAARELAAGDVLVLGPTHRHVSRAASALAALGVPVAADGLDDAAAPELAELLILVRALLAPGDAALVAAALQGPAAGCTLDELVAARRRGVRFGLDAPVEGDGPVAEGLRRLQCWWQASAVEPADVLLGRLLDETGLLAWAACGALGHGRVGKLLALLDGVRAGGRSLAAARGLLERRHERDVLVPRPLASAGGAVRLLTVHGAKGLEAEVVHVVGASATTEDDRPPARVVQRDALDAPRGAAPLRQEGGVHAAPLDWPAQLAADRREEQLQRDRLRYVAVTRAKRELRLALVIRTTAKHGTELLETFASPFARELHTLAQPAPDAPAVDATLPTLDAPPRPALAPLDDGLRFRTSSVTKRAGVEADAAAAVEAERPVALEAATAHEPSEDEAAAVPRRETVQATLAWGRCVHRAAEAALRGRTGTALSEFLDAVVKEEWAFAPPARQADARAQLDVVLTALRQTPAWARLTDGTVQPELGVLLLETDADGVPVLVSGVADATAPGLVVDWKTTGRAQWAAKLPAYQAQVQYYADAIAARDGRPWFGEVVPAHGPAGDDQTGDPDVDASE